MGVSVNLNKELVASARRYAKVKSRSIPKQIEHWSKIGRIAEDNPDLSYEMIRGILRGLEDLNSGNIEKYRLHSL